MNEELTAVIVVTEDHEITIVIGDAEDATVVLASDVLAGLAALQATMERVAKQNWDPFTDQDMMVLAIARAILQATIL